MPNQESRNCDVCGLPIEEGEPTIRYNTPARAREGKLDSPFVAHANRTECNTRARELNGKALDATPPFYNT